MDEVTQSFVKNYFGNTKSAWDSKKSFVLANKDRYIALQSEICEGLPSQLLYRYVKANNPYIKKQGSCMLQDTKVWYEGIRLLFEKGNRTPYEDKICTLYLEYEHTFGVGIIDDYNDMQETSDEFGKLIGNPLNNIRKLMYMFRLFEHLGRKYFLRRIANWVNEEDKRINQIIKANPLYRSDRKQAIDNMKDEGFSVPYTTIARLEI